MWVMDLSLFDPPCSMQHVAGYDYQLDVWFMLAVRNINIYLYSTSKLTETDEMILYWIDNYLNPGTSLL